MPGATAALGRGVYALESLTSELPIHAAHGDFVAALARGPVVLSSPTGSGKSTEVPRWCEGRTLVVEPRRIACRSLAARVAQLEGSALGAAVGYCVRDERALGAATRILFATPGMALRDRSLLESAQTVILDEFHERSLDTDLLLALLMRQRACALVIMSATIEAQRVAEHVGGQHVAVTGRAFPVAIHYLPGRSSLPDADELPQRVRSALGAAAKDPGDVLVFLPGKAEIEACAAAVGGQGELIPLHGGLSLSEQRRAFEPSARRKIILATNVAETSLTIPGIGVVIDAGLVRQTRYHEGRSFLALGPIAEDSAAQRAGRAGRTAPGVCYRLWNGAAQLQPTTAPEIHREPLVSLVLTAAAWGARVEDLPLLDPPKSYALAAARAELEAWGALAGPAELSATGRLLFALPIDPRHARLLVAAREHECVEDMIDLLAVLSVGRPLFERSPQRDVGADDDLRSQGCDASAAIQALRAARPADHGASSWVIHEARQARARLRQSEGLPESGPWPESVDRGPLLRAILQADPRCAHVARKRGRDRFFSNGGTEIELARESALNQLRDVEALLALDTRGFGAGRDARILVTCAMPVPLALLAQAGLGEDRLASVQLDRKRVVARIERVYAKRVLSEREEVPQGELARAALVELLSRGSLFRDAIAQCRARLLRRALAARLAARQQPNLKPEVVPDFDSWLRERVQTLGVENGEDAALLSAADFSVPELSYEIRASLDSDYPETVSIGDATYRAEYDIERAQVLLHMIKGSRREPPPLAYLPKFPGLRICVQGPRGISIVRA
jgi:ATP-dependent helicase HrpB